MITFCLIFIGWIDWFLGLPKFAQIPKWWRHTGNGLDFELTRPIFFEFSDQFHIRKVLLALSFTPHKKLIIKNVDQISSWNIAWNRHLKHVTSLFPKPSPTPEFAFFYPCSDCKLWKFTKIRSPLSSGLIKNIP